MTGISWAPSALDRAVRGSPCTQPWLRIGWFGSRASWRPESDHLGGFGSVGAHLSGVDPWIPHVDMDVALADGRVFCFDPHRFSHR